MINHKMNFLKNGWSIIKSKDPKLIKQLFEIFKNQIKKNTDLNKDIKNKIKDIKSTRTMTNKLEDNTLNSIRKIYLENFSKKIVNIFSHELKPIFGKKLLIQRYPQIQIHVGFKHSTKTFPHCEMMAAHSPYTYNIWMPFHDIIDNSGIFLIDDVTSVKLCDKEIKKNVKDREKLVSKNVFFPKIKLGEALIFNPFVTHGSVYHKNIYSRLSLDFRVQSFNKPLFQRYNDFFITTSL
tara:strand:+ start:345 stop:1055 length:711 start_codon:yes stop_codon:yes gene_type:complete